MRKVLGVLIVFVILFVGIGFQRGWFTLSSPGSDKGIDKVNVNLATDTGKIKEDAAIVKEKAAELTGSATDQPTKPGDGSNDDVRSNGTSSDQSL